MIRIVSLRILVLIALSVALIGLPPSAFAQHGGHGGGGGFHGGGAFHGGGNFGGFHGGAVGFHSGGYGGFYGRGFYGFRGHGYYGGFGFPAYGFGFGFGFGPYWGYPYYYGYGWNPYAYYYPYGSYYYPPYYYPDGPDYPRDNSYPRGNRDGCDYRDEDDHPCKSHNENVPPKPSSTVPDSAPEHNYVTTNPAANGPAFSLADYRPSTNAAAAQLPSGLRPAVRNVIEALRAMPPEARLRQLNSGRYHNLAPQELEFVTNATQPSAALATR